MSRPAEVFTVPRSLPAERLDLFLREQFPEVSRGTIQRLIEEGQILVDGKPTKPTHSPRAGEVVTLNWPDAKPSEMRAEEIPLDVLYEDECLLVLNKAPGMVVHPAAGHDEHTLVNALLHHCAGQLSGIGGVARPGIVHRLDKETSGCLVVAKTDESHLALGMQFASRKVQKVYHAIVCGDLQRETGDIRAAIARHPSHRKRMATDEAGRAAHTSYRVLERLKGATLVEALLHTGRTHQIRVHFQFLRHPLAGDMTYGNRQNQRLEDLTGFRPPRVMLHAFRLSFTHPRTARQMAFEAPRPADFADALSALAAPGLSGTDSFVG
jgi:23S rRNA pseudouridine1911/1915/1917 synthase